MLKDRRGVTLIELMLATVAMLIVGGAVQRMLQTTQRLGRAQADQLEVQSSVRGAVLAVTNELRELSTRSGGEGAENDLLSIASGDVTYRAMRGTGFLCETALPGQLRISRHSFSGYRTPQAGRDSVLVLHDPGSAGSPIWVPLAITGVSTTTPCSGGGYASVTLAVSVHDSIAGAAVGTPVRVYEIMQLKIYESGGKSWLGMRSVSAGEALQPLFGPMHPDSGFRLDYLDGAGRTTSTANAVKSIRVAITGQTAGKPVRSDLDPESGQLELHTQVVLRNAVH